MVNLGLSKVDDAVAAKHPFLQSYAACQSFAFMKGTAAIMLGATALFTVQKALQRKLPYPLQWNVLITTVGSSALCYAVSRWEAQKCADLWMLLETGKVPDRSPPPPPVPQVEESQGPAKTKYGDVME
ncbi:transmembrane protein 141 [Stegastes partitus]|uniref:Transmembrane protein 141 n=1 Tax=Stegastes partitus TaxID=144197 RepID=A0A3B4ZJN7_9TELE|nr:PREDICTED: transmembrane protein 141 [Stegastes partitus]